MSNDKVTKVDLDQWGYPTNMIDMSQSIPCRCLPCHEKHQKCNGHEFCQVLTRFNVKCRDHTCFTFMGKCENPSDKCGFCGHKKNEHNFYQ